MRSYDEIVAELDNAARRPRRSRPRAASGPAPSDWRKALAPSGKDGYVGDERNVIIALRAAPELAGLLRFNEFALEVELTRSPPWNDPRTRWTDEHDTALAAWLQEKGIKVRSRATVADVVALVARDRTYHPVRDFLVTLKWDGTARIDHWLERYLDARGNPEYLRAVGARFLIAAVARIMSPGCQADYVLVLEGPQGLGKTTVVRVLAMRPEWCAGNLPDVHTKDAPLQLIARWIIEISEMRAVRSSQLEAMKNFITETHDTFRAPYARRTAQFPRQCVFIGTTNDRDYLRDRTGNRRFWPVSCGAINLPALTADREQLWAEALVRFRAGEQWHLTAHETALAIAEQADRTPRSELEQDVGEYLAGLPHERVEVTVREVLTHGLRLEPDQSDYTERARRLGTDVAEAIEAAGWQRIGRRGKADARRTVYRRTPTEGAP